ncbi:class I SAM-dependent methyltransferase [Brevundimonas goettingensis]|uniref:Methyltransferase domain-containing protein n=1 Tax=Brevundimonas goettingensis TaxID=2774190 RepID=A0A975C2D1_9CAUL|nr:methyltransferase domain-containing protein [Brevundimonas goettingensis]QTC91189.1 methyltransferase domain-containing protein [Brevundimonas goettingensis]
MLVDATSLGAFVSRSDEIGGPGSPACDAYWADFSYQPSYRVDQSLDPFSEAYVAEQIALYREIAGRELNQVETEMTALNLAEHVAAVNPYNHPQPSGLALHIERLSKAMRLAEIPRGGRLIDMGCGWGLSSELAAYLGLSVRAVDINPDFVSLVNQRAARSGWDISAVQSPFDSYEPAAADAVLFYECLHHAVRPWTLIETLGRSLGETGKIVLAGEPINAIWWTHWGLRLDAFSVYCIHKFGWFESGWSEDFLTECFLRAGLATQVVVDADPLVGFTVIARPLQLGARSGAEFIRSTTATGFSGDPQFGIFSGEGSLDLVFPREATRAELVFQNFRPRAVPARMSHGDTVLFAGEALMGPTVVTVDRRADRMRIDLSSEVWVPDEELGNGDPRRLSLHLETVTFA